MKFSKKGFSLVELSIVLTIITLLIAAVIAGKRLVTEARLQKVISDVNRYGALAREFKEIYGALPGDMANANDFWSGCGVSSTASECNGDGDEQIEYVDAKENETYRAWQHMYLAKLLDIYAGPPTTGQEATIGSTVPKGGFRNGGYNLRHYVDLASEAAQTPLSGNVIAVGAFYTGYWPANALFVPEEVDYIDKKMDDGVSGEGKVRPSYYYNGTWQTTKCLTGTFPTWTLTMTTKVPDCLIYFSIED